jgi:hypothetical protein
VRPCGRHFVFGSPYGSSVGVSLTSSIESFPFSIALFIFVKRIISDK